MCKFMGLGPEKKLSFDTQVLKSFILMNFELCRSVWEYERLIFTFHFLISGLFFPYPSYQTLPLE